MLRVHTCCGCCRLRIGLYVYGVIILIFSVYLAIHLLVDPKSFEVQNASSKQTYNASPYGTAAGLLVTCLILVIALIGAYKEKPLLLIPYIIVIIIDIILSFVLIIWCSVVVTPFCALAIPIYVVPKVYVCICFLSYYAELREKEY